MIERCRSLFERNYTFSTGGNVSHRWEDGLLMEATNTSFGRLTGDDFALCDLDGAPRPGCPQPSKEVPFHAAIYRRRPDVAAVLHLHAPATIAASTLLCPTDHANALPVVTPYAIIRVGRVPLIEYIPPGSPRLGERVGELCVGVNALVLQNHGLITFAPTLDQAVDIAEELEQTYQIWLSTRGMARILTDDEVAQCKPLLGATVAPGTQRPELLPGVRL